MSLLIINIFMISLEDYVKYSKMNKNYIISEVIYRKYTKKEQISKGLKTNSKINFNHISF